MHNQSSSTGESGSTVSNGVRFRLVAVATGILFGLGLSISQMVDRQRVLGFLTLGSKWDPTLLFVMGSAVCVTLIAFRFVLAQPRPVLDDKFHFPPGSQIDKHLVTGAAIFGVGWGLSGYCPGPGVAALVQGQWNPVLFVLAFAAGSFCCRALLGQNSRKTRRATNPLVEPRSTGEVL